ncbi:Hypothetical predicted protein [Octopus vulgaris]|uniref:Uncharacterized protein n=1 Tax=Octopus vulgaris TaxID=6645 RepID=A0AA36F6C4_OCTVU|nr:Hypothetical predicted protein [Octopus vulgaris]
MQYYSSFVFDNEVSDNEFCGRQGLALQGYDHDMGNFVNRVREPAEECSAEVNMTRLLPICSLFLTALTAVMDAVGIGLEKEVKDPTVFHIRIGMKQRILSKLDIIGIKFTFS